MHRDNPIASTLGLLSLVLMGLAWLIPNHYPPWTSYYNEACMFGSLGLLVLSLLARHAQGGWPLVGWAAVALAAIPWVQWAGGLLVYAGDAWVACLYLLAFALAIGSGAWASREDKRAFAGQLATTTLVAGAASSVLAILQAADVGAGIWIEAVPFGRPAANLGQPNNLAALIGMAGIALLLLREQQRIGRAAAAALATILLMGLAITNSRVALLFGPAVCFLYLCLKHRGVVFRTPLRSLAGVTILHCLGTFGYPALRAHLLLDAAPSIAERGVSSLRFKVWPVLLDALSGSPWLGFGWLQVGAAELAAVDRHPPTGELWMHAHNLFLDLLIWCGYPLGLLICVALLAWFATRLLRLTSVEGAAGLFIVGILGSHAMFELPHHYAYFLIPVGLWIGIIEHDLHSRMWFGARGALACSVVAVVLAAWIAWDYAKIEEDFRTLRFEVLRIGPTHAADSTPVAPSLSSLVAFLRYSRTPPRRGMDEAELANMKSLVARYPYAPALYRYAQALALNGRPDEAVVILEKLRRIHDPMAYRAIRSHLHDRATEPGEPELARLDAMLPKP